MKSYNLTAKDLQRRRFLIDAEGQVFGRLASRIASILMGKHTARYTPGSNDGDRIVVINAEKVRVTGNKLNTKIYRWHTGYPGGLKEVTMGKMVEKKPDFALKNAVRGMLPHNARGRKLYRNLKIICGKNHPYASTETLAVKL